jgi:hypothetical protein
VANGTVLVESDSQQFETTTDADGRVSFTVPNSDFVEVTVVDNTEEAFGDKQLVGDEGSEEEGDDDDPNDIQIEIIEGTVAAGEEITIQATLAGSAVSNASVYVESDTQVLEMRTDDDGQVTFTIPNTDYASVTVEAENTNAFGRKGLLGESSEAPPDDEAPSEEGPGVEGDITIDIVDNTVRRGEEVTIQATLDNEPVVNASVRVGTDSDQAAIETTTDADGRATFSVPDTEVVVVTVQDSTRDSFGEKQLFGEPDGEPPGGESELNISILDTSVEHTGGPAPDESPTVDAFVAGNMLQVQLKTAPNTGLSGRDLTAIGATTDTEFEITVKTTSFDPRLMIGAGNDVSWDYSVDSDSTEITITTKPASQQLILPDDGQTPRLGNWPEGEDDQATTNWDVAADFAIDSLSGSGQEELQGGYITTDAQSFSTPVYFPPRASQSPELQVDIAGPHLTVDGEENDGFYRAKLPESLLSAWNVSDPSALSAAYKGSEKDFDATNVDDGVVIELDVDYSSGTVQIGTALNDSAPVDETDDNTTTGPPGSPAELISFGNTSQPSEVTPNSLGGKLRAETAVADDIEVELLRNTATNYSLAITAPDGTENVTFYLQSQAIESSQDIDNVTMYLDDERRDFYVDENAGPGQSPWIGFQIDEFSTRTVTFTSDSSSGDETAEGFLSVATAPATVTPSENVTHTYTINNAESRSASYTLRVNGLSSDLTVTNISGDIQSFDLDGDWPTANTTSLAAGTSGTVAITYRAAADATGQTTVDVSVEESRSGTSDNVTTDLTIQRRINDYANQEGIVNTAGLIQAIGDWRNGDVDTGVLLDVINAWRSNEPVV